MKRIPYSGSIKEVTIGTGDQTITLGGETAYPFHTFEGDLPHRPIIAMEIWDYDPGAEWAPAVYEPFKDVAGDPAAWAKKCVEQYGAEAIVLQLKSTDPNDKNASPEEAAAKAKAVSEAISVPLIVWGVANKEKDIETLRAVAEACQGKNMVLGPVEEANHKQIGATALGYNQIVAANSPIDVNLAKQLNILLGNLGVGLEKIIIDPTTGGLGYGLEYSYSVMERIRMAALTQDDDKLMQPMINNIGNEVWKSKEAKLFGDESTQMNLGDDLKRGYLMEAVAAVTFLLAGSDIVILRHPETVKLVRGFIDRMMAQVAAKQLGKTAAKKPVAAAPKPAPKPAAAAPAAPKPQAAAPAPAAAAKPAAPAKPAEEKVVDIAAAKKEKEAEAAEAAKAQAEAADKAKAAAQAKADAETAAQREARDAAKAEREAAEAEIKAKRAAAKAKHAAAGARDEDEEDRENLVIFAKPRTVAGPDAIYIERKLFRVGRGPIIGR
jgi:acetyl-CoA decarbonylase/synthase complex subunit delta